jgi:VacB/RNase II family 3'-5' exoribonuclease
MPAHQGGSTPGPTPAEYQSLAAQLLQQQFLTTSKQSTIEGAGACVMTGLPSRDSQRATRWRIIGTVKVPPASTIATFDFASDFLMTSLRPGANAQLQHVARDAMRDHGLLPDFSPAVLAETEALTQSATAADATVRDLRDLPWASIDNDDSRDLDQLSVAGTADGGAATIFVAVADVDALVKKGSNIDNHAAVNTTSVYTAAEIFPMLPEKLSTNLTSLNPDQDRLAVVVEMTVADDGSLTASAIYRAVVRNHAKLAYNSVASWLEGTTAAPAALAAVPGLDEQLRRQSRVAQTLKRVRENRGALQLDTLETRPIFSDGTLADLAPDESNRAKELIEDFMVTANGVVARFLGAKAIPSLRRVLRTPQRWDRIVALAAQVGATLPALPDALELDAFLHRRRQADPDHFADLSLAIVKLLGAGEYALETPGAPATGHFALAVQDYTHSTAPNRRFPDLVTQRILKAALEGQRSPYSAAELTTIAAQCNLQQRNAAKVERQVAKSAAALILSSRIGATFKGIVTGVSDKGTWVRISGPTTEGRVVKGAQGLDVGDRVAVQLIHTDVDRGFIDFAVARAPA